MNGERIANGVLSCVARDTRISTFAGIVWSSHCGAPILPKIDQTAGWSPLFQGASPLGLGVALQTLHMRHLWLQAHLLACFSFNNLAPGHRENECCWFWRFTAGKHIPTGARQCTPGSALASQTEAGTAREAQQNFNVVDHETMGRHGVALRRFKLTYREILRHQHGSLAKKLGVEAWFFKLQVLKLHETSPFPRVWKPSRWRHEAKSELNMN